MINFPTSPTQDYIHPPLSQQAYLGKYRWVWNGVAWDEYKAGVGVPDSFFIPDSSNTVESRVIQEGLNGIDQSKWEVKVIGGFRLPTEAEWSTEKNTWSTQNAAGAIGSVLKLTLTGRRNGSNGSLDGVGSSVGYWSNSINSFYATSLTFNSSEVSIGVGSRVTGRPIRLIQDTSYTGAALDFVSEEITINGLPYNTVLNPTTNRIWLDRNLGASKVAESSTDSDAYGDLYQWGRGTDGHEKRDSGTTAVLSSTDTPGHGDFITSDASPFDWRSIPNDLLWQGVEGINNPAPPAQYLLEPKDDNNKVPVNTIIPPDTVLATEPADTDYFPIFTTGWFKLTWLSIKNWLTAFFDTRYGQRDIQFFATEQIEAFTITADMLYKLVEINSASTVIVTVDNMPVGGWIPFDTLGAGLPEFVDGVGDNIFSDDDFTGATSFILIRLENDGVTERYGVKYG